MTGTRTATLAERYVDAVKRDNYGLIARLGDELEAERVRELGRLDAPDALLKAALWYASVGVAVFPCRVRDKQPVTEHGLKDASTDPAQIRRWWSGGGQWNIGAPTGITFDVIDIDGRDGIRSTYGAGVQFPDEIGHVLTTREAGHHVFISPTGRGNGANVYPSVDFRGKGGYVILPPSRGANGRRYVWTRPLQLGASS